MSGMDRFRVIVVFLGISVGFGGVIPRYSLPELVVGSEAIVQGSVTRSWTSWDGKHLYLWTHYEVQVAEVLKGSRAQIVTVSEPGGTLDGVTQLFSGQVPYSTGEQVMLFLYRTPLGFLRTRGGPQGKFSIAGDAGSARLKARVREAMQLEGR
jgi:hypothetical protein